MLGAEGSAQRDLHARAAAIRDRVFDRAVVVRGVVELTNLCRVNCDYCPMRRDNTRQNDTYLLDHDEIVCAARRVRDAGVDVIVFQGGEIPQTTPALLRALPEVRALFDDQVEVLLGLGVKSEAEYRALKERGADSYIIKHETSDATLHRRIRREELERPAARDQDAARPGLSRRHRLHRGLARPDHRQPGRQHPPGRRARRADVQRLAVRADRRHAASRRPGRRNRTDAQPAGGDADRESPLADPAA